MKTNKDSLSNLFHSIELDEPSFGFCDKVMYKVESYAKPNKISLSTFMILLIGATAITTTSLIIIFKDNILFFIQRIIAPYIIQAMRFLNNFSWPEISTFSLIMTIISCAVFFLALLQAFAQRSKKAADNKI